MLMVADTPAWAMVLAPTVLSIVAAGLYAAHREFQTLRDRVLSLEYKVDILLRRTEGWANGPGQPS